MTIITIFLALFAASCNGAAIGGDPFSEGFNSTCAYAYMTGCKIGQQNYGEGVYDVVSGLSGGYLSFVSSATAGFACGLCESGFFGPGNTTQGNGKGAQCGDREAECCKSNGPQCSNSAFQQAYNDVQPASCKLGYNVGKGRFDQASLISAGAYSGVVLCVTRGIIACSPIGQAIGGSNANQILANVANVLRK